MRKPEVSVVICHHRGDLILRCLESVYKSEGVTYDVLVISSDETFAHPRATVYTVSGGPAHKRNVGVSRSRGDVLVFLDDDVEISPYCLYELKQFLEEHPECGMAFGKIYNMERRTEFDDCGSWFTWTGFLWARAGNYQRDVGQFQQPVRCLASKSATCAIRRGVFHVVGGFDAAYFILGEDTDLAWRVWLRGWEVWYAPRAVSWHAFGCESLKPRADYYTIQRTMTYGCRNYLSMLWTNLSFLRLAAIFPLHLSAWCMALMGFAIRGDFFRAHGIMRGLQEFCQRLPDLSRKRHRVQSTRVISDRLLFQSIYYSPGFSYYLNRMWRYWTTQLHG